MTRIPHNIEPRKFDGHTYRVGYDAYGYAWRIRGDSRRGYSAMPARTDLDGSIWANTLADMGARLSSTSATSILPA